LGAQFYDHIAISAPASGSTQSIPPGPHGYRTENLPRRADRMALIFAVARRQKIST